MSFLSSAFRTPHIRPRVLCLLSLAAFACSLGAQTTPSAGQRTPITQDLSGSRDAHGSTALIAAATAGDTAAVKSLVGAGANLDATDVQGRTALIAAVQGNQPATAKALAAAGANLNLEAHYVGSALNVAENNGDTELAAWLLSAGAHSTGKSVGDTVCVRPWGGQGYCGTVKAFTVRSVQLSVTKLVGCGEGCPARLECSASNPVGGVNGLHLGEQIAIPSWCLTDTAVKLNDTAVKQ